MLAQISCVSVFTAYGFLIIGLNNLYAIKYIRQSMYRSVVLECPCGTRNIYWTLNSSFVVNRPGKVLVSQNTLKIFDLRFSNNGVYKCFNADNASADCTSVCLEVDDPEPYYKAVHRNLIPDSDTDEEERPYWHQKMKTVPEVYEFTGDPLRLSCYFYFRNSSLIPKVRWILPQQDEMVVEVNKQPTTLNCSSIEETQRNLTGSCYLSEITIYSIVGSDYFSCNVRASDYSTTTINNTFTVLQSLTHLFSPNLSNTDIDDYEAPNFELIDELRLPDEESYNDTSSDDAYSDINDKKNTLDLSKLILTNYTQFQFYMLDFVACLSKDVTLLCQIPWALNQLEVWYSGLSSKQSKLLKNSTLYESLRNNEKGYALFDNTITLKLSNLSHKDSGLYICRNDVYYKKLMITVVNCSKSGFIQSLLPSILIWTILLITISSILLSLIYCIWVRRKSMQTVLTLPIDFLDKHAKSKRVDVFRKFNSLYSESTNVLKHKLLLHYSSSTSSSSSGADASLSSSTVYSRSTSSDISNNTDADTKRQITGILTTFSQRLLCQPTNFSSLEHSTLHCNMVLLEWLREYLTSKPKTYLPKSSFTLENVIGQGNYGMIYKGKLCTVHDNENNTEIAVKTLKSGYRNRSLINLIREAKVLTELKPHPHIIKFYGICIDNNQPYILLELGIYGNLRDFLRNLRPNGINFCGNSSEISSSYVIVSPRNELQEMLSDDLIKLQRDKLLRFALDIAYALHYFESLSLFHRDVAARNVIVTEGFVAKLCDFGYTCTENESKIGYMQMDRDYLPAKWMAPECLTTQCYTSKCDVWSYGILLWEIFSMGNTPYEGINDDEIIDWLSSGNRNPRPYLATSSIYQLMLECWSQDPHHRPVFHDICDCIAIMKSNYGDIPEINDSTKGYVELMSSEQNYVEPRQHLY